MTPFPEDMCETLKIFGNVNFLEQDLYWIFYPENPINREDRQKLKDAGYRLQKHSRTRQDIWIKEKLIS